MKKILVTGSLGFLASRFIDFYNDKFEIHSFTRLELDITSEEDIYQLLNTNSFDYVFHCAAISDTGLCLSNPSLAYDVNVVGTHNLAKACAKTNTTLIFASSDQVYNGNNDTGPYTEDITLSPQPVYGQTKLEAERLIKQELTNYYNLRLTWLFSMPEPNKKTNSNILMQIINAINTYQPIEFATNEYRAMTYVYDVIEQIEPLLSLPYGDYNFGSMNHLSTYDTACEIFKLIQPEVSSEQLIISNRDRFIEHPRDLRIDTTKLKSQHLLFPTTIEGIKKCLVDFNHHKLS